MKREDLLLKEKMPDLNDILAVYEKIHTLPISQHDAEILHTALVVYVEANTLNEIAHESYMHWKAAYKMWNTFRGNNSFMSRNMLWLIEAVHFEIVCHGFQSTSPWGWCKLRLHEWWNDSLLPRLDKITMHNRKLIKEEA